MRRVLLRGNITRYNMFSDLKEFRGIHDGKLGFVIGCGVSVKDIDPKLLTPYVVMSVTESIFKFKNSDYLFTCDGFSGVNGVLDTALELDHVKIIGSLASPMLLDNKKCFIFAREHLGDPNDYILKNDAKLLIWGVSSAHPAVHLMHIMGCNPIVLLGMDGKYVDGCPGFWLLPEYYPTVHPKMRNFYGEDPINRYNQLHTDAGGILNVGVGFWNNVAKYSPHVNIINSSMDSAVNGFKKMTLANVLLTYGDRKK